MSALTRNRASATVPNEIMLKYYVQRAKGGAGLIVSEANPHYQTRQAPGLWNKPQVDGWKKITDAIHEAGSKIYAQVSAPTVGRVSHPDAPEQVAAGVPVYAPSALSVRGGKFSTCISLADPTVIIAQFKDVAINAKEAGFDGVELHGANGYIVHQFLDSTSNKRTDKWGGSPENRTRAAINNISEFLQWAASMSMYHTCRILTSNVGKKRATPHDVVETFRPLLTKTAIFVNSDVIPEEAEELIKSGKAAGVFMGMKWLTHPDLGRRIREGKPLDNAPNFATLYGAEGVDLALGSIDYKEATY
ncbi:hypothetical protein C8R45DRAFT_1053297 [Mycena sanguinolenta]|nr:hypothetical protein C8R45DRAFT_1053297 [Mycena sanguinolenta]